MAENQESSPLGPSQEQQNTFHDVQIKDSNFGSLSSIISDLDRRLRTLEERYSNLRKKVQLSDQNLIETERSFIGEMRTVNEDLMELKRTMNDFSEKIVVFGSELEHAAKKQDIKVLEKYLILWSPQNFVTRNELKEYLKNNKLRLVPEKEEE